MKIVILDGYTLNPGDLSWDRLGHLGELTVYDRTESHDILNRAKDAEIIFTNKTVLTEDILNNLPNLKFIGVLATGYNVVDVEAAKALNIKVANVPTYGTTAVAQFTMGLLLEICHHIGDHSNQVLDGEWTTSKDFCFWNFPLMELSGKTLGLIGMGKIGQETAKIASAFGMKILYNSRTRKSEIENESIQYAELDELLENSHIISLHCPLFESTKEIINKDNIAKMKDGVIILNTSRGGLIKEEDLADALNNEKVGYAGLDVLSTEPPKKDNPLLKAKNCIITPHIAWAPKEARERLLTTTIDNLESFLNGDLENIVNL